MSRSSIIALVVFVVLAGLILTLRTPAARRLQANMIDFVAPLHATTSSVGRTLGAYGQGLKTLGELEKENELLRVQNADLRTTNQMLHDLGEENAALRQALDFQKRSTFKLLPARIIARSASTWWSTVQIDRGEADGLDGDMPVVTDVGLVGKTTTVAQNTAYVLLIADENCKVAANIEGTREQGIMSGERVTNNVQPELVLNFLSKDAVIKKGQKVFSSGVSGGVFPSGLLLGTIKDFQPRVLDQRATVTPAVDLSKLENVFIVIGKREPAK